MKVVLTFFQRVIDLVKSYYQWLHGKWPAGLVEKLPVVGEKGLTNVDGLRVVGDLSGVPLLKFSSETGVQSIRGILAEASFPKDRASKASKASGVYDVVIIGGGVSGISAAMEAKKAGLSYVLFENAQSFNTVKNFPKGKPIFTYPTDMTPSGGIQYGERSGVRETLLEEMQAQVAEAEIEFTAAQISHVEKKSGLMQVVHQAEKGQKSEVTQALRTIVAIGRSGNYRKLGVSGEELDKVMNRLHDPKDYCGRNIAIVGGGDSAAEAAVALAVCGAKVTLVYRGTELTRPKPENIERLESIASGSGEAIGGHVPQGELKLKLGYNPVEVTAESLIIQKGKGRNGKEDMEKIPNEAVFSMIGREAPLDFFRRSGVSISGERNTKWWVTAALSMLFFTFLYLWKGYDANLGSLGVNQWGWPNKMPEWIAGVGESWKALVEDRSSLIGTMVMSMKSRSFYYTLAYCLLVTAFGGRRIQRSRTPYVTRQTVTLMLVQWFPLFIIPEIILPFLGYNGAFAYGTFWDQIFEPYIGEAEYVSQAWPDWGHPRAYWRAYGIILAWPLFVYNLFTNEPMMIWLVLSLIQTFVVIPYIVLRWGKGAYCGWICSCGALAETVGDQHRHKMPHGPFWNRLNMIGQVFLGFALLLMLLRVIGWINPEQDSINRLLSLIHI